MNNKTVLVTGTFNICHSGHIRLFEFASKFGDVVVGVNADAFLWEKYGKDKTISLDKRVYVLKSIRYVNDVVVFTEEHPGKLIEKIKPDFYVKGPDYQGVELPENFSIISTGCKLIIHNIEKENSTSTLIQSK